MSGVHEESSRRSESASSLEGGGSRGYSLSGGPSSDSETPMAFPVTSKRISASVQGVKTELVLCGYDDSILVVVTQIGKMGTLLRARKDETYSGGPTYTVNILMGKRDEPFLAAFARQLIEHLTDNGGTRSLVLSLGLRDHSPKTLKSILQLVIANKIW